MITNDNIVKIHYDLCDSTNLRAREYLKEHSPKALLITANAQSAGRGRQGKSFFSPKDTGLYMTFAFRANVTFDSVCFVTTAAAAKVCDALERVCGDRLFIKWVNDIYYKNKKICGILCESVVNYHNNMVDYVIIGVGVNLCTEKFPKELEDIAGSIGIFDKTALLDEVTRSLCDIANSPTDCSFLDYYRSRSMVIGKDILCITVSGDRLAHVLGIDDCGGLIVRYEDGVQDVLRSGEISIRTVEI